MISIFVQFLKGYGMSLFRQMTYCQARIGPIDDVRRVFWFFSAPQNQIRVITILKKSFYVQSHISFFDCGGARFWLFFLLAHRAEGKELIKNWSKFSHKCVYRKIGCGGGSRVSMRTIFRRRSALLKQEHTSSECGYRDIFVSQVFKIMYTTLFALEHARSGFSKYLSYTDPRTQCLNTNHA